MNTVYVKDVFSPDCRDCKRDWFHVIHTNLPFCKLWMPIEQLELKRQRAVDNLVYYEDLKDSNRAVYDAAHSVLDDILKQIAHHGLMARVKHIPGFAPEW